MTERVIVPREATEEMVNALRGAHHKYIRQDDAEFILRAALAASPNAGEVTEEELEKAAAAAFNSVPWDQTPLTERVAGVYAIRRALSSLGIKVGG